jgi:hypothetical protein
MDTETAPVVTTDLTGGGRLYKTSEVATILGV